MATESVKGKIVAVRVCDAIARIGYSPHSAIMDIVDNSVAANATHIRIQIYLQEGMTFPQKSNVNRICIIDDGCGMSEDQLLNALNIGTIQDYAVGSLSKYGMGLKSAGFSLGPKVAILSKKDGVITRLHYVDRRDLGEDYTIYITDELEGLESLIPGESGTIVLIADCQQVVHPSARRTVEHLTRRMGVTYHKFLTRDVNPLAISIEFPGVEKPVISVVPRDILFVEDSITTFDKDTYDCKTPILVSDTLLPVEGSETPIRLEVSLFPQAKLATQCVSFTDEERQRIKSYEIGRENKGFFIYRNDRLIRWGDDLDGLVDKDDIQFRARISLSTEHDDALHIDVSKQNLNIPEGLFEAIERHIATPLNKWQADIRELCKELLAKEPGQEFSARNQDLSAEDDEAPQSATAQAESQKRRKELAQETGKKEEEEQNEEKAGGESTGDKPSEDVPVTELPIFRKIRYSNRISGSQLWEMGYDETDGVFVRVNTNHSFYHTVLSRLGEGDSARQAIESMLWCSAAGEYLTIQNLTDCDSETIRNVIRKFKKTFSGNLEGWCESNEDLFDA